MGSMSYCLFENTMGYLHDIIVRLDEAEEPPEKKSTPRTKKRSR